MRPLIPLLISFCLCPQFARLAIGQMGWLSDGTSQTTVLDAPSSTDWKTEIDRAKQSLRQESLPQTSIAKKKMEAALERLRQLVQPGVSQNGDRWFEFLKAKSIEEQLEVEEPDEDILIQLERNMRQNHIGLDWTPLINLRSALYDYFNAVRFSSGEEALDELSENLDTLLEELQKRPEGSDASRQREISSIVRDLLESQQAMELARRVRAGFARPNVRVLITNQYLSKQFSRAVTEPNPVHENILGTDIHGNSIVQGFVAPVLVPNTKNATIRLELNAQFSSDTIGYNRGVVIFSQGSSPLRVSETLSLFESGVQSQGDTSVSSHLQNHVTGIQHRSRLVRRIAGRQIATKQPLATAIGESRLVGRLGPQFHQQLESQLAQASERLRGQDFSVVRRLGLSKPTQSSWTSQDYLALLFKQQDSSQLAAPSSCPIPVERTGVTLQIHQSALLNSIDPVMAGRKIENKELAGIVGQFTREVPEQLKKESEQDPWSITFAKHQPIEVEFDRGLVHFRIHTTNLGRGPGQRGYNKEASVEAAYRIHLHDNSIQLLREGEVVIKSAERGTQGAAQRGFLKSKFVNIFKEELFQEPLRPLQNLPPGAPQILLRSIQCESGWLQIHAL